MEELVKDYQQQLGLTSHNRFGSGVSYYFSEREFGSRVKLNTPAEYKSSIISMRDKYG